MLQEIVGCIVCRSGEKSLIGAQQGTNVKGGMHWRTEGGASEGDVTS